MTQLTHIVFFECGLHKTMPEEFSQLTNLAFLSMPFEEFSG